MSKSGVSESW